MTLDKFDLESVNEFLEKLSLRLHKEEKINFITFFLVGQPGSNYTALTNLLPKDRIKLFGDLLMEEVNKDKTYTHYKELLLNIKKGAYDH